MWQHIITATPTWIAGVSYFAQWRDGVRSHCFTAHFSNSTEPTVTWTDNNSSFTVVSNLPLTSAGLGRRQLYHRLRRCWQVCLTQLQRHYCRSVEHVRRRSQSSMMMTMVMTQAAAAAADTTQRWLVYLPLLSSSTPPTCTHSSVTTW